MESPQEQSQTTPAPIPPAPPQNHHNFPVVWLAVGAIILLLVCGGAYGIWALFSRNSLVTWVPFSQLKDPNYLLSNEGGKIFLQREKVKDVFEDADPKTLVFATTQDSTVARYAKDATHVYSFLYLWVNQISGADPRTFSVLPFPNNPSYVIFAKDKNAVYVGGTRISGADPKTFIALAAFDNAYYAKDRSHVYFYNGVSLTNERPVAVLPGADAATFVNVSPGVFKDKHHVYGMNYKFYDPACVTCQQADAATFLALGGGYFRDKNHLYWWDKILKDVSTTTFAVLDDSGFAKDTQHVYHDGDILKAADPNTFKLIEGYEDWYTTDSAHVFIRGFAVDELDPKSLVIINQNYAKDVDTVWLTLRFDPAGALPNAEPSTFEMLPIKGTQAATFAPIESEWSRDATHVYFLNSLLPNADPKTFVALSGRLGKDSSHVYCMERLVRGADPATFVASATDAWSGQDKNHRYDCEKIVE
jgi:DKNYY family